MQSRSIHLFLEKYPINPKHKRLILGTFHPLRVERFLTPFFYGNRNSIWGILREAFPKQFVAKSQEEISLNEIVTFLKKGEISMSDTVLSCIRLNNSALDSAMSEIELNVELVEQITNSDINQIFFTSSFGKNSAFRLFYEGILKKKITPEMRTKREFLDLDTFGRPVRYTLLFSPSGSAMRSIVQSREYREVQELYKDLKSPVKQFRVDRYRDAFSFVI